MLTVRMENGCRSIANYLRKYLTTKNAELPCNLPAVIFYVRSLITFYYN